MYVYLSECEKLIRSLRSFLTSGQLATEGAFWKADALVGVYTKISDQPSRTLVVNFLVDVNVPEFLTEIVRTLHGSHPDAFSPGKQENNASQELIRSGASGDEITEITQKKAATTRTEDRKPAAGV